MPRQKHFGQHRRRKKSERMSHLRIYWQNRKLQEKEAKMALQAHTNRRKSDPTKSFAPHPDPVSTSKVVAPTSSAVLTASKLFFKCVRESVPLVHNMGMGSSLQVEVKVEPDELEIPMDMEPEPIEGNGSGSRPCLICSQNDGQLFTGNIVLDGRNAGATHPKQVQDDMRIIFLLKSIFKMKGEQLSEIMQLSNGEYPASWIFFCESCRDLVSNALDVYQRLLDCKKEMNRCRLSILRKMESVDPESEGGTHKKIRSVAVETMTTKLKGPTTTSFAQGDLEAERRLMRNSFTDDDRLSGGPVSPSPVPCNDFDVDVPDICEQHQKKSNEKKPKVPKKLKELFVCPFCQRDDPDSSIGMNILKLIPHVLFHYDNPIKCLQCKISLPKNEDVLKSHWLQYHSDIPMDKPLEQQVFTVTTNQVQWTNQCVFENRGDQNQQGRKANSSTSVVIQCVDCVGSTFRKMNDFKLHQLQRHPETCRVSCPLCPRVFSDGNGELFQKALEYHLICYHRLPVEEQRLYTCQFCGEIIPVKAKIPGRVPHSSLMLHMLSRHGPLIKLSYICTIDEYSCEDLKEFLEHSRTIHSRNSECNSLFRFKSDYFGGVQCGLCEKEPTPLGYLMAHITACHDLYLKWKWSPTNPSKLEEKKWKPVKAQLDEMQRINRQAETKAKRKKKFGPNTVMMEKKFAREHATYLKKREPKYVCEMCPQLEKMNLDYFIQHLIFHWRRPNKCTSCSVHLPLDSEVVENHWKHCHPDLSSETSLKSEPVNFRPVKVFECVKCSEKFETPEDRDHHQNIVHKFNLIFGKSLLESCSVCGKHFRNADEVRLHRALKHPEVADETCYYCNEVFVTEGAEGLSLRDYDALQEHILAKEDHPKFKAPTHLAPNRLSHVQPCQYCGKVMVINYKDPNANSVKTHVEKEHGIKRALANFCSICNQDMSVSLYEHFQTIHVKPMCCDKCGKEMKPRSFPEHMLNEHDIVMENLTLIHCPVEGCQFKTYSRSKLRTHDQVCHGKRERKYVCSICGKGFLSSRHKSTHEETHVNKETKPFQCEICGARFAVRNYLYIHRRLSHLNQKFPSTNRKRTKKKPEIEDKSEIQPPHEGHQ